ncbi:MAG: hypothetical protein ABIJ00_12210 [Candidatus Eisenbacteria bacterium]
MLTRFSAAAVLIAAAIALGYLLSGVPNVEGMSAVTFLAGCLLGAGAGALVGAVSIALFSVLNPLGPALPHVLAAQVAGMSLVGVSGDLWRRLAAFVPRPEILAAGLGALLTVVYGVLADYGFAVSMGRWKDPWPVIIAGIPFSTVHIISNAVIFFGVSLFAVRKYKIGTDGREA